MPGTKILLGIAAAAIAALIVLGLMYRNDLIDYGGAVLAAKANARTVERMTREAAESAAASAELQARLASLEASKNEKIIEVVRIVDESVCGGAALRHVLDGLRHGAGAGGRAASPAAGGRRGALPGAAGAAR